MKARCQCGQLAAEVSPAAPATLIMCHCVDCQRRSGSQFGSIAYYPAADVTIFGDAREFTRPTDRGNTFTNGFCATCGSSVYARTSRMPDVVGVMAGAFADPALGPPIRSVYEQSRHDWVLVPETTTSHMRGRDS